MMLLLLPGLESLRITESALGSDGAAPRGAAVEALRALLREALRPGRLVDLDLAGNNLGDAGASAVRFFFFADQALLEGALAAHV